MMAVRWQSAVALIALLVVGSAGAQQASTASIVEAQRLIAAGDAAGGHRILQRLGDGGDREAKFLLVDIYAYEAALRTGREATRLLRLSARLLRDSATLGHLPAQMRLCEDVDRANRRAAAASLAWCRTAADAGNGEAQAELGIRYREGIGTDANLVEARRWFRAMVATRDGPVRPHLCQAGEDDYSSGWVQPQGPGGYGFTRKATIYSFCLSRTRAGPVLTFRYGSAAQPMIEFQAPRDGRFTMTTQIDNAESFYTSLYFTIRGTTYQFNEFLRADTGAGLSRVDSGTPGADMQCNSCAQTSIDSFANTSFDETGARTVLTARFVHMLSEDLGTPAAVRRLFTAARQTSETQ